MRTTTVSDRTSRPLVRPQRARKSLSPPTPPSTPPPHRDLCRFAIDPSLSQSFETTAISEMTFRVPWEPLKLGRIGEYVAVIDFDPGIGTCYEPVDLDDPHMLAQDGLPPSDGTPQFHQLNVYTASMSTIANFEYALGGEALWPETSRRCSATSTRAQTSLMIICQAAASFHACRPT